MLIGGDPWQGFLTVLAGGARGLFSIPSEAYVLCENSLFLLTKHYLLTEQTKALSYHLFIALNCGRDPNILFARLISYRPLQS